MVSKAEKTDVVTVVKGIDEGVSELRMIEPPVMVAPRKKPFSERYFVGLNLARVTIMSGANLGRVGE